MAKQYDLLMRLLLVGDSGVGKTCLLCRYVDNEFYPSYSATIGIDFKVKHITVNNRRIRIQIWDTAGQERFETITKQYYRRAQGCLLIYDITNEASFKHVSKWLQQVRQYGLDSIEVTLIGNKTDLNDFRQVSREDGFRLAQSNGFSFFETSAITDSQIELIFEDLARRVLINQANVMAQQKIDILPSDSDQEEYVTQLLQDGQNKKCQCS